MSEQLNLDFAQRSDAVSGVDLWRERRRAQMEPLASRCGLPIGHTVQLWLTSGILLDGRLHIADPELWISQQRSVDLHLQIGRADFRAAEVESCVRTD